MDRNGNPASLILGSIRRNGHRPRSSLSITRRLCRRKGAEDNELYRSNSFKFERFERHELSTNTGNRRSDPGDDQICWPEYSLPLDQVGRPAYQQKRVGFPETSNSNQVEVLETYCDPRDSRYQRHNSELDEPFYQSHPSPPEPAPSHPPLREYSQPYTTDGSSDEASSSELSSRGGSAGEGEEDEEEPPARPPRAEAPAYANVRGGRGARCASLRQPSPSPYYYGDLDRCRKAASLGAAPRCSVTVDGLCLAEERSESASSSSDGLSMPPRRLCAACQPPMLFLPRADMAARARQLYETAFDCKVARSDDDLDDVDRVSNHPLLMQLASSSSSTVDPASSLVAKSRRKPAVRSENNRRPKNLQSRPPPNEGVSASILSENFDNLELNDAERRDVSASQLPLRGYTPSPPSTAPLPTKFQQSKDGATMNSIKSAPNLPSHPAHPRLKDLRLPVKSLRARETPASSEGSAIEIESIRNNNDEFEGGNRVRNMIRDARSRTSEGKGGPRLSGGLFLEIKGRPGPEAVASAPRRFGGSRESGPVLEFKGRPGNRRRRNYSSMESVATSSSGGSMESIRSSTSEGNRSTSSSESRPSTSLSSHSSDSGNNGCFQNLRSGPPSGFISHHANKLHILSPISDKSSQEPASETSDNAKNNNNSQKASPEDCEGGPAPQPPLDGNVNVKIKRRMPQNKNLLNLVAFQQASAGDAEIQGSDSGISLHSRDGIKSRNAFLGFLKLNQAPVDEGANGVAVDANDGPGDFSDLPFDMPKLRRRRAAAQDACTSGSATSVDLRELPFDMPKLRRRLRAPAPASPGSSGGSHASSSHSVRDADRPQAAARPNLTLNLDEKGSGNTLTTNPNDGGRGLNLNFGNSSNVPVLADVVDTTLPLERQGWYHGAMTRVEAEGVLRGASDGGFLVRNCESARKDYSLSLKSARGFMHMRIQQSEETGKYILGQFSRPFDTIPEMIRHFCLNRLPVRGAEHMCLSKPVIAQLL